MVRCISFLPEFFAEIVKERMPLNGILLLKLSPGDFCFCVLGITASFSDSSLPQGGIFSDAF